MLNNLRTGQTTSTGGVAGSRKVPVMSELRHAPFGGMQSSFHHPLSPRAMLPCSFASGCRVTYDHHEVTGFRRRPRRGATRLQRAWLAWGHLARFSPRRVVSPEEAIRDLMSGLSVVHGCEGCGWVPVLHAHLAAPCRPRYSLDQRAGGHVPARFPSTPKGQSSGAAPGTGPGPTACLAPGRAGRPCL